MRVMDADKGAFALGVAMVAAVYCVIWAASELRDDAERRVSGAPHDKGCSLPAKKKQVDAGTAANEDCVMQACVR